MEFKYVKSGQVGFFFLAGGLTVGAKLDDLRLAIGAIPDTRVRAIFLDLAATTYLDCTGIGELIRLRSLVVAGGRKFGLVNVGYRKRRLLELARLDALLGLYDSTADALRSVAPGVGQSASEATRAPIIPREVTRSLVSLTREPMAVLS